MKRLLMAALLLCTPLLARAGQTYPTPHGKLLFVPGPNAETTAELLARTAEADRDWAIQDIGVDYDGTTEVRVAIDPPSFVSLQPLDARAPAWAGGVAYPDKNLVVLRVDSHTQNPRALLRHELSHIAVGRLTHSRAPRWLLEGLAMIHAGDSWNSEGPSLVRAALADNLFSFEELETSFPSGGTEAELAYAQSAHFVQYLVDRFGEDKVRQVLLEMVHGAGFDEAVSRIFQATPRQLENAWRRTLSRWEMLIRAATSHEFFWGVATILCLIGGLKMRQRRRRQLQVLHREEQAESMRALLRAPAVWADAPAPAEEPPAEPVPEVASEEEHAEDIDDALDDDDFPDGFPLRRETAPKKPTLH